MQNHLMHAILAHMHFSVLFSLPGPTLCIFHVHLVLQSVPLHMKAHSLSLSLSLFLPPSLPFYSLALPRSPSIWNGNEQRFCGCLHPSSAGARGPSALCPLKAQIKVQSVIYSPHESLLIFLLKSMYDPSKEEKTGLHFKCVVGPESVMEKLGKWNHCDQWFLW